jgi:hypothetical protein
MEPNAIFAVTEQWDHIVERPIPDEGSLWLEGIENRKRKGVEQIDEWFFLFVVSGI